MNEQVSVGAPVLKRKRRPNATPEEKADWAKRFAESGLRQREFCRQHGLVLTTLQRWLVQAQSVGGLEPPVKPHFAEVKLTAFAGGPRWVVEVCRPSGLTLRLAHDVPAGLLERLLQAC